MKPSDPKLRRKLWNEIAKFLFDEDGNHSHDHKVGRKRHTIAESLQILNLKEIPIEDLIKYLPCEEKLSSIKHHLIESMNIYHNKITELQEEQL
jgi:hypothetical protein